MRFCFTSILVVFSAALTSGCDDFFTCVGGAVTGDADRYCNDDSDEPVGISFPEGLYDVTATLESNDCPGSDIDRVSQLEWTFAKEGDFWSLTTSQAEFPGREDGDVIVFEKIQNSDTETCRSRNNVVITVIPGGDFNFTGDMEWNIAISCDDGSEEICGVLFSLDGGQ